MRSRSPFTLSSPWRQIFRAYVLIALAFALACFADWGCSAHAGEVRRAKRVGRALAKPIRAQGRTDAGYPIAQAVKYTAGAAFYGARTVYQFTPGGLIGTILWR